MKTSLAILTAASLVGRANAQDFTVQKFLDAGASIIAKAVNSFPSGEYTLKSVATGKFLAFERDHEQMHIVMSSSPSKVTIDYDHSEGDHKTLGAIEGLILGGDGKCVSAQWFVDEELGYGFDKFAVPYACAFGSMKNRQPTLEDGKQVYLAVPCGNGDSSSDSSSDFGVSLNAKLDKSSNKAATAEYKAPEEKKKESKPSTPAATEKFDRECNKPGWWLHRHPQYIKQYSRPECKPVLEAYRIELANTPPPVVECPKDGEWLNAHPEYIKVYDHPECKPVLEAYRNKSRRNYTGFEKRSAAHASLAASIRKRELEKRASKTYCLITWDHLHNQPARAISNKEAPAFANAGSLLLDVFDPTDKSQWWTISTA